MKHENGTAYAELQMEAIIEGNDDDFHRNLLKSMSQNLDELKKEIEFFNQTYENTVKLNIAQEELNKLTDLNGIE